MRIATYNVEWFNALFDRDDRLLRDGRWSSRYEITRAQQSEALIRVFRTLDADAVLVVEAPDTNHRRSTVRALENFAAEASIRARRVVMGFANETQQELALLYDPDVLTPRHDPQSSPAVPRFDASYRTEFEGEAGPEPVRFSKPPLELAVETRNGRQFRMIGVHAKSKAPNGATGAEEILRVSIANRRKQLAQCVWLRARVDEVLAAGDSLIVLGDLNDGPGIDDYEHLFGRSGVEIVMGLPGTEPLFDPNARAALARHGGAAPVSARFYVAPEERWISALLDYILISQDLRRLEPRWRIWHPFDDRACWRDVELRKALMQASDHFPVTLDILL